MRNPAQCRTDRPIKKTPKLFNKPLLLCSKIRLAARPHATFRFQHTETHTRPAQADTIKYDNVKNRVKNAAIDKPLDGQNSLGLFFSNRFLSIVLDYRMSEAMSENGMQSKKGNWQWRPKRNWGFDHSASLAFIVSCGFDCSFVMRLILWNMKITSEKLYIDEETAALRRFSQPCWISRNSKMTATRCAMRIHFPFHSRFSLFYSNEFTITWFGFWWKGCDSRAICSGTRIIC